MAIAPGPFGRPLSGRKRNVRFPGSVMPKTPPPMADRAMPITSR